MTRTVQNEPERSRYVIREDGEIIGVARYLLTSESIMFTHTEVVPARRNTGAADTLVRAVLDDVQDATQLRVISACEYVTVWLRAHPAYQPLQTRSTNLP